MNPDLVTVRTLVVAAIVIVVAACGRAGAPVAPERVVPEPAADLRGVVVDDGVELGWTLPTRRADGARLRELSALHVFRAEDDGLGEPKPALASRGRLPGYAEVATVRMQDPAPAVVAGTRMTVVDRAALTPGRRYTYVVLAEDGRGHVSRPSERISIVLVAPPAMPTAVHAVAGDREVRLTWRPPARLQDGSGVTEGLSYEILRAPGAGARLEPVTTTTPGQTSFVDRALDNERAYVYAVRALRTSHGSLARGPMSERVTATPVDSTPPRPPTELVAIPSEGAVRLVWLASPDADVGRYIVYRAREGGAPERVGSTAAPGTTFTDRDVPAGRWRYAVSAQDVSSRANESGRSAEVTVTVP